MATYEKFFGTAFYDNLFQSVGCFYVTIFILFLKLNDFVVLFFRS